MKIYVETTAYNEEYLIGASLKSVYDFVDEIIVVDGSAYGPSTDRTAERALAVGEKVKLFKGTFTLPIARPDGSTYLAWGERDQRQACLDKMEKSFDNWCIAHDADEIFDPRYLQRLVEHIRNNTANPHIMSFSYCGVAFYRDFKAPRVSKNPLNCRAFRLIPGVACIRKSSFGIPGKSNWKTSPSPERTVLDDVFFYHFHDFDPYERRLLKARYMVERGGSQAYGAGYKPWEWERFKKDRQPLWLKGEGETSQVLKKLSVSLPDPPSVEDFSPWIETWTVK